MDDIIRYYKILGLEPGASQEEIKQAYRDLVRVWHPDRYSHDPRLQEKVQEKLKEINEAYEKINQYYSSYKSERKQKQERDYKSQKKSEDKAPKQPPKTEKPEPIEKSYSFFKNSWIYLIPFIILAIIHVNNSLKVTPSKPAANIPPASREVRPTPAPDDLNKPSIKKRELITIDRIKTNIGELSITKGNLFDYCIRLNGDIIYSEKNSRILSFHTHLRNIDKGEVVLVQESSATRAWFRLIMLKSDGSIKITDSFGNGSDLPEIKHQGKMIKINFPGAKDSLFQSEFWVFKDGQLLKRRDAPENAKLEGQAKRADKAKPSTLVPQSSDRSEQKIVTEGYFTIGSTENEVLAVQGTPTGISFSTWNYGFSSVTFENGKVKSFHNFSNNLKVRMASKSSNLGYFTIGSTEDEVLAVQGTPTGISFNTWNYGFSSVTFENRKVKSFHNFSNNLKVRVTKKEVEPPATIPESKKVISGNADKKRDSIAKESKDKIIKKDTIKAFYQRYEIGDYNHAIFNKLSGGEISFWCSTHMLYFLKLHKGELLELSYQVIDTYIREAGGVVRIEALDNVKAGNETFEGWMKKNNLTLQNYKQLEKIYGVLE